MEQKPAPGAGDTNPRATPRKTYQAPTLKLYGSIGQLTRAVGSQNGDAGQGMMP